MHQKAKHVGRPEGAQRLFGEGKMEEIGGIRYGGIKVLYSGSCELESPCGALSHVEVCRGLCAGSSERDFSTLRSGDERG